MEVFLQVHGKSWTKSAWKMCFSEGSQVEKLSEVFAGQISGVFLSRVKGTLQGQTGGRCHRRDHRVEIVPLGAHDDSAQNKRHKYHWQGRVGSKT